MGVTARVAQRAGEAVQVDEPAEVLAVTQMPF